MLVISSLLLLATANVSPTHLRCQYLTNPIGLDSQSPRLSWIDQSGRRGAKQVSYEVWVASSPRLLEEGHADMWDSGKINSDDSAQIAYEGDHLKPGQAVWWKVKIWDEQGQEAVSSPASWELGLPIAENWHAKWITLPQPDPDALKIPSPYLRKTFGTDQPIESARAYVSAKGLYRLYIDGHRIGKAQIAPDWTDYRKRIQYQTYDIAPALKGNSHAVGLVLGNGWYCGHVGLTGGDNYGDNPEGIVQIQIRYKDGSSEEIVSDGSWKGKTGAILSNDLLMGESEDARNEPTGWTTSSYKGDGWNPVQTRTLGNVPLVAQQNPPVEVLQEIKPKKKLPQKDPNVSVFDLGQNMVGWARLKINGPSGQTVRLRFAEMLGPDGTIYTTNLRGARATDFFTLSGKGTETFEPSFTTHGFRYVEVTGANHPLGLDAITGIVVGSANPLSGEFQCSNPLINQLQHNIFWGERGNYISVPTDCPQRDERLGWMGDAQIFVRNATYNNDIAAFMTKWTQDQVDAQSPEGGFPDVTPRMGDQSDGAPAWGDAGVIVPWTIYTCYGDRHLLEQRYPAMRKWVDYIDSVNPDHIWVKRSNNNFGDWLNVHDDTPRPVIATAYFAYSTDIVAKAARILGKIEDSERYEKLRQEIGEAFDKAFVDDEVKIQGDSQTDYVLALRFGLLPPAQREAAGKRLVDHILIDRKGHLSTGFVGVGYLNPTLTAIGRSDVAYKLLTNDTYPSWGYSIRQGATTIWERWDGWTQDKGFQDPGMNSFNHYSLGSVGEWMYRTVGGIDLEPGTAGFKHIVIHPIPGGGLTWAHAKYDSIQGTIASSWKLSGKEFSLDVTIPTNTTARICLPKSATPIKEGETTVSTTITEGNWEEVMVGGGHYHFTSTLP